MPKKLDSTDFVFSQEQVEVTDKTAKARQRSKEFRERRKLAGLCERCGIHQRLENYTCCEECRERQAISSKKIYDNKVANSCCTCCNKSIIIGLVLCEECSIRNIKSIKERRIQYNKEGKCRDCGKEATPGSTACSECRNKNVKSTKERRAKFVSEGLCRNCGKEGQILDNLSPVGKKRKYKYCQECWFKLIARNLLGSANQWSILVDKWIKCGKLCPYTGEELTPGVNLSFDHILPSSRYPELKYEPSNVEPVSWRINLIKGNLTKDEFLVLITTIHTYTQKAVQ